LCDPIIIQSIVGHSGYFGTCHVIQDLLMPFTYAAVTALLKDTDAFKYDRLYNYCYYYYYYYYYYIIDYLPSVIASTYGLAFSLRVSTWIMQFLQLVQ